MPAPCSLVGSHRLSGLGYKTFAWKYSTLGVFFKQEKANPLHIYNSFKGLILHKHIDLCGSFSMAPTLMDLPGDALREGRCSP